MSNSEICQLLLPSLRALIGDWVYYPTIMKMSDIAKRINVAGEIHKSDTLKKYIQRELDASNHSAKIKEYLLSQQQRFFNSLVIGVYGGAPKFFELEINYDDDYFQDINFPIEFEGILGFLFLEGSEALFAIDGQHRVVGIRQALEKDEGNILENEEVSVIFVAHKNDDAGMVRTRRLFTTLNRYAKPVNKFEIIALDEDDAIAIVTRRLIEEHPLFRDKISLAKQKRISSGDKKNVTTIITLYDVMDIYLRDRLRGWKDFKRKRPDENLLEEFYDRSNNFWNTLIENFPALMFASKGEPKKNLVQEYRHESGGHLLFRPIGLQIVVKVIKKFTTSGLSLSESVGLLSRIPLNIAEEPWSGLLWDPTNQRMITAAENQKVAEKIIYFGLDGNLGDYQTNPEALRTELIGILNREDTPDEIILPRFI